MLRLAGRPRRERSGDSQRAGRFRASGSLASCDSIQPKSRPSSTGAGQTRASGGELGAMPVLPNANPRRMTKASALTLRPLTRSPVESIWADGSTAIVVNASAEEPVVREGRVARAASTGASHFPDSRKRPPPTGANAPGQSDQRKNICTLVMVGLGSVRDRSDSHTPRTHQRQKQVAYCFQQWRQCAQATAWIYHRQGVKTSTNAGVREGRCPVYGCECDATTLAEHERRIETLLIDTLAATLVEDPRFTVAASAASLAETTRASETAAG